MTKEEIEEKTYLKKKRLEVLEAIKPMCEVFHIKEYDYDIENGHERLVLNGQQIACGSNSIEAIVDELIGYIFIKKYCKHRYLGVFNTQTKNVIMEYWYDENGKLPRQRW